MATVQDGQNPGRMGQPARQAPARKNSGRGVNSEPTIPSDPTPATIFGANTALGGTGLPGTAGSRTPGDVTQVSDQTYEGISGQTVEHSQTTLDGTPGAQPARGGESVTYTDPFGVIGGVNRDVTVQAHVDGDEDWTQGSAKYATGPTLPGLAGNRPTSSGLGHGRLRGAGKGL
jgi:hypothetical protein